MQHDTAVDARTRPVALRIVERVASAKGVESDELEPLAEAIDSDALTDLASSLAPDGEIVFEYEGFAVSVRGTDQIRLSPSS